MKTNKHSSKTAISKKRHDNEARARRGARYWLLAEALLIVLMAMLLFAVAGRWDWTMGWALLVLYGIWVAANALLLMPRSPTMLAERLTHRFSDKTWDNIILVLYGFLTVAKLVIAGLDFHYGWTKQLSMTLQISALAVAGLAYALMTWAMTANPFFAIGNRIQVARGHEVATEGPYFYVRHPGYVGSIVFELATPLMLGSLWALIPGGLAALLIIVRTAIEDHLLYAELSGYSSYAQQTRYRLLPGIW